MSKRAVPSQQAPVRTRPGAQRLLAVMAFAIIGVSAIAVVVVLVLRGVGVPDSAFRSGGLAIVALLPVPGLPIGLLLVIGLIIANGVSMARRGRR